MPPCRYHVPTPIVRGVTTTDIPPQPRVDWEILHHLSDADVHDVGLLVDQVTETDGDRPLSEHVLLHLRYGGDVDVRHILARVDSTLVGYAHLDVTDGVVGPSVELAVAPFARRRGIGRQLVEHARLEAADDRVRLWAHGEHPSATALATSLGFRRLRTLWQLRRTLETALPDPQWPAGIRLRTYLPGMDDDEWLALNARAFVALPDQGSWTHDHLEARMREPWFDPTGFFVAVQDDPEGNERMVGFHWTKVHGAKEHDHEIDHVHDDSHEHEHAHEHEHEHEHEHDDSHEHEPDHHGHELIGEVYIVGLDPSHQGLGLGRALTLAGLRHLRALGLHDVMLYVDAENKTAIRLYEQLGFTRFNVDVEYGARPAQAQS